MDSLRWHPATLQSTKALVRATVPALPQESSSDEEQTDLVVRSNETKRLLAYYDPTTLDGEQQPRLQTVDWTHDVPTVNGIPVWERLPNEPDDYYQAFTLYRDQQSPRLIKMVAEEMDGDPEVVLLVSKLWLWEDRAKARDGYKDAKMEADRAAEVVVMKSSHGTLARKLLNKAKEAVDDLDTEKLSPYQLVEVIKLATVLERLSLDLPAGGPEARDSQRTNDGMELKVEGDKVQINLDPNWRSV